MTPSYFTACHAGAGAAVLAFSTTDRASFDALPSWRAKVLEQCPSIAMVMVQNKVDLIDKVRRTTLHGMHASSRLAAAAVRLQCPGIAMVTVTEKRIASLTRRGVEPCALCMLAAKGSSSGACQLLVPLYNT
jgi:GTPase SAR1 family protein